MKTRLTLLLIFIATLSHAQYDYYYNESMFGLGVGYNFTSVVDDDVRPIELSFRYRINNDHLLQLYVPYLRQNDSFQSKGHPDMNLVSTSLDTKKRLYGIGLDYDYALQSFSSLDFVIGLRAECQLYKYRTNLTNIYASKDITFRDLKNQNYIISPNAGLRLQLNRFFIDAKFLLSMLSIRGDVENRIEAKQPLVSNGISTIREWTENISNKFKLKPAIMMSMSYFF